MPNRSPVHQQGYVSTLVHLIGEPLDGVELRFHLNAGPDEAHRQSRHILNQEAPSSIEVARACYSWWSPHSGVGSAAAGYLACCGSL